MADSKASATWNGTLKEGNGGVKGTGFELPSVRLAFRGTAKHEPRKAIGAAHAGCFSMFLAARSPRRQAADQHQHQRDRHPGEGPTVTKILLETVAVVPGIDQKLFDEKSPLEEPTAHSRRSPPCRRSRQRHAQGG